MVSIIISKSKFLIQLDENCSTKIFASLTKAPFSVDHHVSILWSRIHERYILFCFCFFFQVLILKLNKEAPAKKDVFRAPGHQGSMKQLIHFLQTGRLMNMENYSVYTIASVLKKFLRKLPNGIFGRAGEQKLFSVVTEVTDPQEQNELINK